ncbi:uncharacterized protein C8Q71DRAFT_197365 [Rhodofomes roseus]|uniref:Uncharacterized protein n=1 Tax=Rhodofomes roseus TaxID=34475 RepID=A0ABQ8K7V4_9APHY|nr:uncharacterized protein C8Q71DRAFT_197365 [Rhodofomes roseus]KAH9833308.1 hypothetical protein C8Q71DRAFT_197365 [Rhodofomes roseus]
MSPHNKGWLYPPTRREVTLVLFSLTVFILSFNLQASLQLVGVKPAKLSGSYLSAIGLGAQDPGYDRNGRRPKEWRDALENMISGEWEWEEGKVAAVASTTAAGPVGTAAIYNAEAGKGPGRGAGNAHGGIGVSNGVSPRQQLVRWENEVPIARAVTHVPGFSILDNVIMANGTFYLVTDDPSSLPALEYIASSSTNSERPPRENEWEIVSTADAIGKLGTFGGRVFGTSWLALDHAESQDPYTLFSMFRTHSTLAAPTLPPSFSSDSSSQSRNGSLANVPAPLRLIFPNVPTFSSPHIPLAPGVDPKTHTEPRIKSYIGFHPLLQKAALPTLGIWYTEDWEDLISMNAPWIFDRVIIADRGAAERGRDFWGRGWSPAADDLVRRAGGDDGKPAWAAPFVGLRMKAGWWAPVRNALLGYLHLPELQEAASSKVSFWSKKPAAGKPVVTYVSMQDEPMGAGPRLNNDDHAALVAGLQSLQRDGVVSEVHVVKGNGSVGVHGWEWADRMSAIARSSIVLGPYGYQLADSLFMSPPAWQGREIASVSSTAAGEPEQSAAPLLMEFFPPGTFVRDQEFAVRSLGMRYIAWWNDRKFTSDDLPPVFQATGPSQRIPVSANAVMQVIRDEIARRTVP